MAASLTCAPLLLPVNRSPGSGPATTIRLSDPDCDVTLGKPKRYPARHGAFRGEMMRHVMVGAARLPLRSRR
jgi:hypothetical protein